ncbi:MAG: sigma 54-interacting transcriptional regulator, partial [Kiritimatiellae bacterium]|nr:sigma 54-interacting transcriptional regulator [Kiritimatiellia bacterium]
PVGSAEPIPVDIRLVAATNRNLAEWVREGKFREDLYFRLNVIDVNLPPLKERGDDLPLLCDAFVREFNPLLGRSILGFEPEVLETFARYAWPGNVRELRNTVERMMVLAKGDRLTLADVPENILQGQGTPSLASPAANDEATQIRIALSTCKNKTEVARKLGIPLRTLYRRLKTYGIEA